MGTSASVFNFEDMRDEPLAVLLKRRLDIPIFIENDSKAMAYGEYIHCIDESWKNILYVNVSWGIGLGIILNGELYYGKDGYAGEFGHIYRYDNDIMCHCGKKGCLETEISGRAICRKLKEQIYNHAPSSLSAKVWAQKQITMMDIINAVKEGDLLCMKLIAQTGYELGKELAGLINLLNPDCIIVGGQLTQVSDECFMEPLRTATHKYAFKLMRRELPILSSRLGNDAGIIGACMIARNKFLMQNAVL